MQAAIPQTPRSGADKTFLSTAVNVQFQALLETLAQLQPHENKSRAGAGTEVLLRPVSSPHQDTLDPLSKPTEGLPQQSQVLLGGPGMASRLQLGLCHPELASTVLWLKKTQGEGEEVSSSNLGVNPSSSPCCWMQ